MKKLLVVLSVIYLSSISFAKANREPASDIPPAVKSATAKFKSSKYVRTSISASETPKEERDPCESDYSVDIKVKKATTGMDKQGNRVVRYKWEVVNTVGVSENGQVMELCFE